VQTRFGVDLYVLHPVVMHRCSGMTDGTPGNNFEQCKIISPTFEALSKEVSEDELAFYSVDVDEQPVREADLLPLGRHSANSGLSFRKSHRKTESPLCQPSPSLRMVR
jgi:hypothetical protein